MKLRHLIQVLIILLPNVIQSQTWVFQQSGTTLDLHGVWFTDSLLGWCCGDSGVILHTSDGGSTWLYQSSGVHVILTDVFFHDMINGWICGDSGTIIHTTDGGNSWEKKNTNVTSYLHKIQFYSPADGVSSGERSTTLFTNDSGKTWIPSSSSDTGHTFILFYYIDKRCGIHYECDSSWAGRIGVTVDEGRTWLFKGTPSYHLKDMFGYRAYFGNHIENFYWMVGDHGYVKFISVFESSPMLGLGYGGQTGDTLNLYSIILQKMSEPLSLWAVGERGWIINSVDTGKTWQTVLSNTNVDLHDATFSTNNTGWIVGDSGEILNYENTSDIIETTNKLVPHCAFLSNAYPNPFNPSTEVSFVIGHLSFVTLKVYDILGREVALLVNERKQAGEYIVTWNAENVPSGVYFYRLDAISVSDPNKTFTQVKKMILLK